MESTIHNIITENLKVHYTQCVIFEYLYNFREQVELSILLVKLQMNSCHER